MTDDEWVLIGEGTAICKTDFDFTDYHFTEGNRYPFTVKQHDETGYAIFEVTAPLISGLLPNMEAPHIIIMKELFEKRFDSLQISRKYKLGLILGEQIKDLFL